MIDIIIPTWNNSDLTVECLISVREHTADARIVWIDNGSTPEDRAKVTAALEKLDLPWISRMLPENEGFSKAVNRGFAMAESDPIILLNNDTVVTAGWADKMKAALEEHPRLGIVGVVTDTGGIQKWDRFVTQVGFSGGDPAAHFNAQPPRFRMITASCVPFCCVAFRRAALDEIGKLDEDFGLCLGEDDDYCDRARRAGWQTALALHVFIYHRHRQTVHKVDGWQDLAKRNSALYARKKEERRICAS
jgi:GT2 family glycosyltransferase